MRQANLRVIRDETTFPTFKSCSEAPPWISPAHVHEKRAQDHRTSSRSRAQKTQRLESRNLSVKEGVKFLKKRSDYLALRNGVKEIAPGFVLVGRDRQDDEPVIQIGITCSKRLGNAVKRNRAKRRLKNIARYELPSGGLKGWDYVLIGRVTTTETRVFDELREDLRRALKRIHR